MKDGIVAANPEAQRPETAEILMTLLAMVNSTINDTDHIAHFAHRPRQPGDRLKKPLIFIIAPFINKLRLFCIDKFARQFWWEQIFFGGLIEQTFSESLQPKRY